MSIERLRIHLPGPGAGRRVRDDGRPEPAPRPRRRGGAAGDAVVLFAAPPGSTLWLYQGVDDGAGWTCDGAAGQPVQVTSETGIVMAKLPARTGRETYAIGAIEMAGGSDRHLRSGPNAKVPVFNAVPGKVTLVGGVKVLDVGEGVSLLPDPSVTARAPRASWPARIVARIVARTVARRSVRVGREREDELGRHAGQLRTPLTGDRNAFPGIRADAGGNRLVSCGRCWFGYRSPDS